MSNNVLFLALNVGVQVSEDSDLNNDKIRRMDKGLMQMEKIANGDEVALIDLITEWKGSIYTFFYRSLSMHGVPKLQFHQKLIK